MKRLSIPVAICLFSLALLLPSTLAVDSPNAVNSPKPPIDLHLTLGNPSDATTEVTDKNNFLMIKSQFALSYNNRKGEPNWVSGT